MQVGDVVGNYRITGTLGKGGMGTVFLAKHTLIGREAAIKVLQPALCSDETAVARFFNEAKTTTAIRHPGIVEVFDFGYAPDGSAYLVMERLEGESLGDRLRREERLPADRALSIARQVSGALYAAHKIGIVHRDLKPDNIFIVPDLDVSGGERAKILDFGVAKLRDKDGYAALETQEGAVLGAPIYMAPEQCSGAERVDHRTDLYALGIILFEMLCGRPPFDGMTFGVVLAQQMREIPAAPSSIEPSVSPEVDALVLRLLEKSPDRRFQDSFELLTRFHQLSGLGAPAAPQPGSSTVPSAPMDLSRPPANPTMSGVVSSARRTLAQGPRYRKMLEDQEKTNRSPGGPADDELTTPLTDGVSGVRVVSAQPVGLAAGSQRRPATPGPAAVDEDSDDGEGYVSDATEDEILSADLLDPPTSDRIQATRAPVPPAVFARQAMAGAQAPIEIGAGPVGGPVTMSNDRRPAPRNGPPAAPGSRERDGSGQSPVLVMPPGPPPSGSSGRPRADGTDDSFFDQLPRADGPRAGSSPAFGPASAGGPPPGPGAADGPHGFGGGPGRDGGPPFGGPPGGEGPSFGGAPGFGGPPGGEGPSFGGAPGFGGPPGSGPPGSSGGPPGSGPPGASGGPPFDGPPGSGGPRFDGPPGSGGPRFDGPPGSGGPRFDGPPGSGPPGMGGPPGFGGAPAASAGAPTLGMPPIAPPFPPGPPPGAASAPMGGPYPGMPGSGGPPPGFDMPPGSDPMSRPMQHDPRAGARRSSGRGGVIAAVVIGVVLMGGTAAALIAANLGDDDEVAASSVPATAPAATAAPATASATTPAAATPTTASATTPAAGAADAGPAKAAAVAQADAIGKDAGAGSLDQATDRAARTGLLDALKEGGAASAKDDGASTAAAIEAGKAASSTAVESAATPPDDAPGEKTADAASAADGASGRPRKDSETNRRPMALITVQIESLPSGAQVFRKSDGVRLGETPFTYQTEPQKASIGVILRHKGYREETLALPGNRSSERRVTLSRTDGPDRAPSLK